MMKVLLVIMALFMECSTKEMFSIVEVEQDDLLVERIYFTKNDEGRELFSKVNFNDAVEVLDSLKYYFGSDKNLDSIVVYNYTKDGYLRNEAVDLFQNFECDITNSLYSPRYFGCDLNDICVVLESILPDGSEVSDLIEIEFEGGIEKIKVENLNARFPKFSLGIQKYFYEEMLVRVEFKIKESKLLKEEYFFETGKLVNEYIYLDTMMVIRTEARYDDGTMLYSNKKYIIR